MRYAVLTLLLGLLSACGPVAASGEQQATMYRSPDQKVEVTAGSSGQTHELTISVQDSSGKVICREDYTSADGEHGSVLSDGSWTPDGQFFVFSTSSSGGHQPWHAPVFFYSRLDNKICSLDEYLPPVAEPEFGLTAPDLITVTIWTPFCRTGIVNSITLPVTFRLSDLLKKAE